MELISSIRLEIYFRATIFPMIGQVVTWESLYVKTLSRFVQWRFRPLHDDVINTHLNDGSDSLLNCQCPATRRKQSPIVVPNR